MLEKNKQEASNISNSNLQQANGNIYNLGFSYSDVKEICRDVIRQEFQIVTKDAVDKLNKLIEEFQNRLIERIAEINNQEAIGKFKEPRYQFVLHDDEPHDEELQYTWCSSYDISIDLSNYV